MERAATVPDRRSGPGAGLRRPLVAFASSWLAYFIAWVVVRWPAIRHNPLIYDDFGIPATPEVFYFGSYRPVVWLEYQFWELLVPGHFWTPIPKVTGAVYIAAAAAAFYLLLRRWRASPLLSFLVPLTALANPVLNEAGLWSSLHAIPLGLLFITLGAFVWSGRSPRALPLAAALLLTGALTYQIYLGLALVLLAAEVVVRRRDDDPMPWSRVAAVTAVVAGVGLIQIVYMQIAQRMLPYADARGLTGFTSLGQLVNAKVHGMFDLVVNGVMPVIAWYTSASRAYSAWKWVPIVLALLTLLSGWLTRRALLDRLGGALFALGVIFIPALPSLAMSQTPYAWRVSAPVAFALALAALPLLIDLERLGGRVIGGVVLLLAIALLVPVSRHEAAMRVAGSQREAALIAELQAHWARRGIPPSDVTVVLGPRRGVLEDVRYLGGHDLTWGYERRTPAMWTAWETAWFAEKFVVNRHGMRFVDCSDTGADAPLCEKLVTLCDSRCSEASALSPRIRHAERGVTLVCPGTDGSGPARCAALP